MKVEFTTKALEQYFAFPEDLRRSIDKQLAYLETDCNHPSLRAKRYQHKTSGLWQARVNQRYRFYFQIQGEVYLILVITDHPK